MTYNLIEKVKSWWLKRKVKELSTEGFNPALPDLSKIRDNYIESERRKAIQDRFAPSRKHLDSKRGVAFINRYLCNPAGTKTNRLRARNIQGFSGRQAA